VLGDFNHLRKFSFSRARCGSKTDLSVEHILPRSCGGPDTPDNAIKACKTCNSGKRGKRLYEWFGLDRRDEIPRIAEGKYLKLLYDLHERNGTLNVDKTDPKTELCPKCSNKDICVGGGHEGKLTVFCLEGISSKAL